MLSASTLAYASAQGMEMVALGWLVLEMTNSPFVVGTSLALRMAPSFFFGLLSGVIADKVDRRIAHRVITAGSGAVAILMALLLLSDTVQLWHVLVVTFGSGCFFAFYMTFRRAYTYDIVGVRNALNGLSMIMIVQRVGNVIGALIAGRIIYSTGMDIQYIVIAAVYIVAAMILLTTKETVRDTFSFEGSVLRNLTGYVNLLQGNRVLIILVLLTMAIEGLGWAHMSALPIFARDVLEVGSVGLGDMNAAGSVGGIVGLILLASLGDYRHKGLLMFGTAFAFGFSLIGLSLSPTLWLFLIVLACANAAGSVVDTLLTTLMQDYVPNAQRGRAMGLWVLACGVAPVGHVEVGWIASQLGVLSAMMINGFALIIISLASVISLPRIRHLE